MLIGLSGCANRKITLWDTARALIKPNVAVNEAALRPDLRYLRVMIEGRAMLMVLGYLDQDMQGRPVQVWYSAEGDVLRLQSGRLVGLKGGLVEWSNVRLPSNLPAWSSAVTLHRFVRIRDEMPGYHWHRTDQILLRRVPASSATALEGVPTASLLWFEEVVLERGDDVVLPPARYALAPGAKEPVYGEQCLNQAFCLSWQVWPLEIVTVPAMPREAGIGEKYP